MRVQEKIFSFVGKGGQIRNMKVIDDERNDLMTLFKLRTTDQAVEKMYELHKGFRFSGKSK